MPESENLTSRIVVVKSARKFDELFVRAERGKESGNFVFHNLCPSRQSLPILSLSEYIEAPFTLKNAYILIYIQLTSRTWQSL